MFNFEKRAQNYYSQSRGDAYPRLKAWDYLWDYIQSVERRQDLASKDKIRDTALNIGFYLANWGMFRGSSQLPYVNIRFFEDLSGHLFTEVPAEFWSLTLKDFTPANKHALEAFDEGIQSIRDFGGGRISWTQTLSTKLLLGVWGHCPARDRYFNQGARKYKSESGNVVSGNVSARYLTKLNELRKKEGWIISDFKTPNRNRYPMGKVIDMAFFQYGFSAA
ncbi:MAG: hypothetical protein LAT61_01115 [Alcanivorax sp.]|nr:hypothetical protein [Alcanivorax sp.]